MLVFEFEKFYHASCRLQRCSNWPSASIYYIMHCTSNVWQLQTFWGDTWLRSVKICCTAVLLLCIINHLHDGNSSDRITFSVQSLCFFVNLRSFIVLAADWTLSELAFRLHIPYYALYDELLAFRDFLRRSLIKIGWNLLHCYRSIVFHKSGKSLFRPNIH